MKKKPMLTQKQGNILSVLLISLLMTAVMTLGMALVMNPGDHHFGKHFLQNFILGSIIAVPTGFIIVPLVQSIIDRLTK